MYDIIVLENRRFRASTRKRKAVVFENLRFLKRFWKDPFSVTVFTGYVWTVDQIGENIRFQTKTDTCGPGLSSWTLSIQPKIPEVSVGTPNGMDHFGLVRPEYSGPALKVVHFDRSGHFGRSDRNVPFHLTKLLSPVPLFCILLTKSITKRAVAWVGSV